MNITIRDGLSIALKVLGFYFIYLALTSLITIVSYLTILASPLQSMAVESSGVTKFALFAPTIIPFLLSIVTVYILLRYSDKISEKLIPVDKEIQIFSTNTWQKEVFIIALRIFGVYEIARRLAALVKQLALSPTYQKAVEKDSWQDIVYTMVCIAIGVYLLAGAKHIVNIVFREKKTEPITGPSA
ncbi:MAG: hypothetical protein HZA49_00540 [Planctomycetes bacterium]|nr:hypothetical protein [Planctomycetota bacterium]